MNIFAALAEPTRRNIVELLAMQGKLSATEISGRFKVSAPAISQHLKVLREANIVQMEKKAQQRLYEINPEAVTDLEDWLKKLRQMRNERYDRLAALLKIEKKNIQKV